ncbi:MAG: penicillin-binding protein activator [Rhodospirillaceae bacterium]|nr:penicillin-binding protein activator [Rhodospirillaceae bacterium]MBT6117546.1 penicillin-binding protein activator [Rhodospirillaceae bacterium]
MASIGLAFGAALLLAACMPKPKVAEPVEEVQEEPAPVAEALAFPAQPISRATVEPGRVRVALLVPLSGRHGGLGADLLDAAQMALFEVTGPGFELVPRDTGGTPDGAAEAARSALQDGAQIIVGPLFSSSVTAAAGLARPIGVPIVGFSTDRTVAGDGVYLMGFLPGDQVRRVVSFARIQGMERFAALAPATPYGYAVTEALERAAAENQAFVTHTAYYTPGEDATQIVRDFASYDSRRATLASEKARVAGRTDDASKAALQRLEGSDTYGELPFQAVMLPDGGASLLATAPLLPYFDIDPGVVRYLGTGQWDDPRIGLEPALIGGWFAAPDPQRRQAFEARFELLFGRRPVRLATLAYDAVALAAVMAGDGERPDFSRAALGAESGYAGLDGIFRFRPDGTAERGLAVLEVQRDGLRVIDPAPATFEPAIN